MILSASVMAHPVRASFVSELQAQLDQDIPVAWDDEGPPSTDKQRRWRTGRKAWEMADAGADWHVTIQDDAIVCDDFLASLAKALDSVPGDGVVTTYWGRPWMRRPFMRNLYRRAETAGASWAASTTLWTGVAIAAPVETIKSMLDRCEGFENNNYDARLGRYYHHVLGWPTWHTMPSLADHRVSPSLIGYGDHGRVATNFHEGSGLELSWDGPVVKDLRSRTRRGVPAGKANT